MKSKKESGSIQLNQLDNLKQSDFKGLTFFLEPIVKEIKKSVKDQTLEMISFSAK